MAHHLLKQSGVYCIRNLISGQIYVGSTTNIFHRWCCHRSYLRKNTHVSNKLQSSWNEYGESAFSFELLEIVEDRSNLMDREKYWIATLKSDCPISGLNVNFGSNHSIGTKAKISAALLGKKLSPEHRAKLVIARAGRIITDETRAKISAAIKGKKKPPQTLEHRAKIGAASRGRKASPETRAKMTAAQTRRWQRRTISDATPPA